MLVGGLVFWLTREIAVVEEILEKDPGEIGALDRSDVIVPEAPFTNIAEEAGIDYVHFSGATGEKLLPETMGGGVAFFDYNNNGHQDLLFINGAPWPHDEFAGTPPTMKLYENNGTGMFTDVTGAAGLDVSFYGMGVAVGDHNNDGNVDLFMTAVGPNHFFRNVGGRFEEATEEAGLAGGADIWSTSAGFFDMDNNGDLDLFVCNYVKWSRDIDIDLNFTLNGRDRAYGPPTNYQGEHSQLYRNQGDGTFRDISEEAGVRPVNPATGLPLSKALALAFADFEQNGLLDIFVANDTTQNFLFRNNGDGTFDEIGLRSGVAFAGDGSVTGAMGIDAAHFRNDDHIAVGIGNFSNEMTSFYVSSGATTRFTDDATIEGIGSPTRIALTFGLFFFDFDLNGRLDLFQTNGHIEDTINQIQSSQHYRQPAQLFWNAGPEHASTYVEIARDRIGDLATPIVGRGAAYADIDGDGDLDIVLTQIDGPALLLRNDRENDHHWLRIRLIGTTANRDAIGAQVELTVDGLTQRRTVMPTRSYLSQVELPITFGLGAHDLDAIESLQIIWPGGQLQEVPVEEINTTLVVEQEQAG